MIDAVAPASPPSTMRCSGCGSEVGYDEPFPFRCPAATGDDIDHVLVRQLDYSDESLSDAPDWSNNPFVLFRRLLRSHHLAIRKGMDDDAWVELVAGLDEAVRSVDGRRFQITPFGRATRLSDALGLATDGGVWIKDETDNVAGSHKARHLMGLMIHLLVVERLGTLGGARPDLAIASCGNAALAAATVAAAARWPLRVFIPTDADPGVVARLKELEADVTVCPRDEGVAGDPTYHRLLQALADGAIPFTCQGNLNGLAIEGGVTLGYELARQSPTPPPDRVIVQVGGGALASAVAQGLREAEALGGPRTARIDTVQTQGAAPLARAHDRVMERVAASASIDNALAYAATHRSEHMWAWEAEPRSVAHGILDDETYDWAAVVRAMLETGGQPVVVDDAALGRANELARDTTGIDVDHTGSAGLAGLTALRERGAIRDDERVTVLFTGARR